ncbi:nuclear transport factor 2 family protein [Streptomyces mirabilis]|uniref:nuclear transport factor 2 family protein n=1 Tax=Streptomyces mirabilis TaxID=68239 RepID=UPI0033A9BDD5
MEDRSTELAYKNLLEVFGERDPQARARVIKEIYTEDVTFSDPDEVVVGWNALDRKAQRLLDEAPGFTFRPAGEVRSVQNLTYLAWHFGPEGAPPSVSGADISIVQNGRIAHLYTMLDPEPEQ